MMERWLGNYGKIVSKIVRVRVMIGWISDVSYDGDIDVNNDHDHDKDIIKIIIIKMKFDAILITTVLLKTSSLKDFYNRANNRTLKQI
jgi:hypothetical protein